MNIDDERMERYSREQQEAAELDAQVQKLEALVRQHLSRDALARYGSIKAAHPDRALQVLIFLGKLVQSGKVDMVSDEQLKMLLMNMTTPRRDSKIIRK